MMRIMVLQLLAWQYVAASLRFMAQVLGLGLDARYIYHHGVG